MKYDNSQLIDIFNKIKQSLYENSSYSDNELDSIFDDFKCYEGREFSDNEYYLLMTHVVFYSGMKASTVDRSINTIDKYFSDYKVAMLYDEAAVENISSDSKMLRNKNKILACIHNARQFESIIKEYNSFAEYIQSFKAKTDRDLFKLKRELETSFKYIGGATSCHFLTDIGFNILKPDRVILRVFYRLGLIDAEDDHYGAIRAGRAISKATNLPIRYIDIIFVYYGQIDRPKIISICTEDNPKCDLCKAADYCMYKKGL